MKVMGVYKSMEMLIAEHALNFIKTMVDLTLLVDGVLAVCLISGIRLVK